MSKLFPKGIVLLILMSACAAPLKEDKDLLLNLLMQQPDQFQHVINNKDFLEVQIIYTRINRDANNRPEFRSFYFNVDSACYFYPASTVKFPVVLMALEKLKRLNIRGLDKYAVMMLDSVYKGQSPAHEDTTALSCMPSVANYIRKILVASDNDAHNRLYEFLGQAQANEIMRDKGFTVRYLQRLNRPLSPDENRHTEAVRFIKDTSEVYHQQMLVADSMIVSDIVLKGDAFFRNDSMICAPMDFSYKNFFPLTAQQQVLRSFLFPGSVVATQRFEMTEDDRRFVLQYLSQLPTETAHPAYATDSDYFPAYGKYLMFGNDRDPIPDGIRIFNKIGNAYGYLIDNAYIVDFDRKIEFMLSAVIATNTDQVYNDEKYDYEKVGYPFMKNVGKLIYNYELKRERPREPDLTEFKVQYEKAPTKTIVK